MQESGSAAQAPDVMWHLVSCKCNVVHFLTGKGNTGGTFLAHPSENHLKLGVKFLIVYATSRNFRIEFYELQNVKGKASNLLSKNSP